MANKPSLIKWVVISLIVLLLLIVVFLSLTPAGTPQTPVDYIAEYNRINKPADYDPNNDAAPYFDKAFAIMVEEPNDVKALYKLWPGDMNDWQIQTARKWIESNRQTIDYLQQAISKKYYWKPIDSNGNESFLAVLTRFNDLKKFRQVTYLLCLDAKLTAYDGNVESALSKVAGIYKMGTFLGGSKFLINQLVGIAQGALAVQSSFQIFDHINPPSVPLEDFQRKITSLSRQKPFLMDFTAERLIFYDEIQRHYKNARRLKITEDPDAYFKKLFFSTIGRPWLAREKRKADLMYDYFDSARLKTPWQFHSEGNDVGRVVEQMTKGTLFLRILAPSLDRALIYSYKIGVQTDALIATAAILRYKADKDQYPQDLQELVINGYLDKLPMDPFSGGPLVYKLSNDNFILYSVAQDFNDNGGKHDPKWAEKGNGDYVFWPVQPVQTPSKTNKSN